MKLVNTYSGISDEEKMYIYYQIIILTHNERSQMKYEDGSTLCKTERRQKR